ncbi:unnamed protein product [Sphagnum jensenii]|uniref:Uncharacterized protein n=1 Tax=Sphagnum jensenii TaxID=128206 RepID=A0ABP1BV50_9BRYO
MGTLRNSSASSQSERDRDLRDTNRRDDGATFLSDSGLASIQAGYRWGDRVKQTRRGNQDLWMRPGVLGPDPCSGRLRRRCLKLPGGFLTPVGRRRIHCTWTRSFFRFQFVT